MDNDNIWYALTALFFMVICSITLYWLVLECGMAFQMLILVLSSSFVTAAILQIKETKE